MNLLIYSYNNYSYNNYLQDVKLNDHYYFTPIGEHNNLFIIIRSIVARK